MRNELLESSMQNLKMGKKSALDDIYKITSKGVYILAYSILRSKERAEDIVQDTYVMVYRKIDKYKPNTNAAAWIYKIARNLACDEYGKRRDISLETCDGKLFNSNAAESMTDSVYLKTVLDSLSSDMREVVVLFVIGDFKHREIAEIINKPIGTVQWLYAKAIKELKERITNDAVFAHKQINEKRQGFSLVYNNEGGKVIGTQRNITIS